MLNLPADIRRATGVAFLFISHDRGLTAEVLDHPRHPYTRALRASVPGRGWHPVRSGQ